MANDKRHLEAIILAAGKGTRMNSDLPKVLHKVADRPMLEWVVRACRDAGASRCVIVVGYKADLVRNQIGSAKDIIYVEQTEQKGTGHAAMVTRRVFEGRQPCNLLVVAGDMPLVTGRTLRQLVAQHEGADGAATLATATLDDPTGYGRIVRDEQGRFVKIVEQKDATEAEQQIKEVNISCYCFDSEKMFDALEAVDTDNAQGEYYITDALGILRQRGEAVEAANTVPAEQAQGINDLEQLRQVDALLRQRGGRG